MSSPLPTRPQELGMKAPSWVWNGANQNTVAEAPTHALQAAELAPRLLYLVSLLGESLLCLDMME